MLGTVPGPCPSSAPWALWQPAAVWGPDAVPARPSFAGELAGCRSISTGGPMEGFGQGEGELITLTYPKPLPMRLDRWLVAQRPEQSRARIQKFIDAGCVRVNGVAGRAKTPLRLGDQVELWMPPPEPLPYLIPQDIPLDVLFEDAHLIVLNKPAGLTVHPAPGNKDGTLVNALLHHCPDLPGIGGELRPGIVHRLDKDTSGCIVVAKSQEALVKL